MKKFIKKLSKKNYLFRKLLVKKREIDRINYYKSIYNTFDVDHKLILIESYQGRNFSCSPRAIYDYLNNNSEYDDYRFVIPLRRLDENFISSFDNTRTIFVKFRSKDYFKYAAMSKYWISNSIFETTIIKKSDQKYLQTWHGTPLKKLAFDIETTGNNKIRSNKEVRKMYQDDASRYDMMCSPSKYYTKHISSAFNLINLHENNIMVETGYPRNDILINHTKKQIESIKKRFSIPKNKKVILYAPTWRDNQHELGVGFTLDLNLDLDRLEKEFSNDYVFIFKYHHFIASKLSLEDYSGFIFDFSKENDINELHLISDILITDYSSLFFDYANLNRPMIFYMYDYDEYANQTRGFYFDFSELPGPVCKKEDELVLAIKNIGNFNLEYQDKLSEFNKKYNPYEDGNSTKRIVEKFVK